MDLNQTLNFVSGFKLNLLDPDGNVLKSLFSSCGRSYDNLSTRKNSYRDAENACEYHRDKDPGLYTPNDRRYLKYY